MFRQATLNSFDSGSYTATVQLQGSLPHWLQNIPVARNIPSAEMIAGRTVALLFFDPHNPEDAVIIAVWTP
jgi:hypothetical protein